MASFQRFIQVGMALDPIHVGTGGARIGRVDLTIVRDPATRLPKIPGSSLAGVYRTYVAMHCEEQRTQSQPQQTQQAGQLQRQKPYYPDCAGLGQPRPNGTGGHCGQPDCPVCTVFGFARGKDQAGGFAGLAAFSDAQILLFPVPTRQGPYWVTCPMALERIDLMVRDVVEAAVYLENAPGKKLNLGWLFLDVRQCSQFNNVRSTLQRFKLPDHILNRVALVPDYLFVHVVNSNLEVRTSVSINPKSGAAEEGSLFSYEALPRATVLVWDIIVKHPILFKVGRNDIKVILNNSEMDSPKKVHTVVSAAHPYLEHLGIGGMGTRGMGRLRVLSSNCADQQDKKARCSDETQASEVEQ